MVDLSQRGTTTKKQRAFHMNDETHDRLSQAALLSNSTMSAVLDRLIWDDLHLPGDPVRESDIVNVLAAPGAPQPDEPEQPLVTGREAQIAQRQIDAGALDVDPRTDPNVLNAKAMERLKRAGHFATKLDGSDQKERDPGLVSKPGQGSDPFDL